MSARARRRSVVVQSRCAIIRFTRLKDEEVLSRVMRVVEAEKVPYDAAGLEGIVFTADGDMRQALNNLQATFSGFGFVSQVSTQPWRTARTLARRGCETTE